MDWRLTLSSLSVHVAALFVISPRLVYFLLAWKPSTLSPTNLTPANRTQEPPPRRRLLQRLPPRRRQLPPPALLPPLLPQHLSLLSRPLQVLLCLDLDLGFGSGICSGFRVTAPASHPRARSLVLSRPPALCDRSRGRPRGNLALTQACATYYRPCAVLAHSSCCRARGDSTDGCRRRACSSCRARCRRSTSPWFALTHAAEAFCLLLLLVACCCVPELCTSDSPHASASYLAP